MANSLLNITLQACAATPRYEFPEITLHGGRFIHVLGPNGAGKSTLLLLLAGLLEPKRVRLCHSYLHCKAEAGNKDMTENSIKGMRENVLTPNNNSWHRHRGYFCTQYDPSFALKVADVLQFFVLEPSANKNSVILAPEIERVFAICQYWDRPITELSTGQQNRVHLARVCQQIYPALQQGRGILLLDEAFSGLDIYYQQQLMSLLQRWVALGNIIVHAHHELHSLAKYPDDEALVIADGKLVHRGRIASLDWSNIYQTIFQVDTI
jgi:vitamin B12 transport system ATP-binding protein